MAWATLGNVTTTHLDSETDSPSQARGELYSALLELQNVIQGRGTANGVASLDTNTKVPNTQLPDTLISSTGNDLTVTPNTERLVLENILNLNPLTVTQVNAISSPVEGDCVYCSNGDTGSACLAVYNGTDWKVVSLGSTISSS
jgi:hypothetical protein